MRSPHVLTLVRPWCVIVARSAPLLGTRALIALARAGGGGGARAGRVAWQIRAGERTVPGH